jgi:hypothetical protein
MKKEIDALAATIAAELKGVTVANVMVDGAVEPAYGEGCTTNTRLGAVTTETIAAKHGIFTLLLSGLAKVFKDKEGNLSLPDATTNTKDVINYLAHGNLFEGITERLIDAIADPLCASQYHFIAAKVAALCSKTDNVQVPRDVKVDVKTIDVESKKEK